MKIIQINSTINAGSTGKIAEGIGDRTIQYGGISYIAYGRSANPSSSHPIKIGNIWDKAYHLINARIFDTTGFHSKTATKRLINQIKSINPDIIHLHNIHGYYLNIAFLFSFLKDWGKPVIWTLHDCWAFTGHCCHYQRANCIKWKTGCHHCPLTRLYPQSILFDNSRSNFKRKKEIFNLPENIRLVTVSKWLESQVEESFLKSKKIQTIYNGVNLSVFKPLDQTSLKEKNGFAGKKIILGVANVWSEGKGLKAFLDLSKLLSIDQVIILIGLSKKQIQGLPKGIVGISRTNNVSQLAEYYNMADVFVNPSIAETFGMVTAEAMACGTPSVVYNSTAMPELIEDGVGFIVPTNDIKGLNNSINKILVLGKEQFISSCRSRAISLFDMEKQFEQYITLYKSLLIK